MNTNFTGLADKLLQRGWQVKPTQSPPTLPNNVSLRYSWLPVDVVSFVNAFQSVVSPSEKSWLITCYDLSGKSGAAFSWNQWEIDSLSAADGDSNWQQSIKAFWDMHFPILLSLKSGYGYVAIRSDLKIVVGEEPEFEETNLLAETFNDFLCQLANGDKRLDRLI